MMSLPHGIEVGSAVLGVGSATWLAWDRDDGLPALAAVVGGALLVVVFAPVAVVTGAVALAIARVKGALG